LQQRNQDEGPNAQPNDQIAQSADNCSDRNRPHKEPFALPQPDKRSGTNQRQDDLSKPGHIGETQPKLQQQGRQRIQQQHGCDHKKQPTTATFRIRHAHAPRQTQTSGNYFPVTADRC